MGGKLAGGLIGKTIRSNIEKMAKQYIISEKTEEAVKAMDTIASTLNKHLGNTAEAINVYNELAKKYPEHRLGAAAQKKAIKLMGGQ